ncbi:MAG: 2-phospho-L-lactate transferase CofD family protein [Vicinamibacteria bacterium]
MNAEAKRGSAAAKTLRVVVFSGGRGSRALSRALAGNPRVELTLAVNGYDDGASTGEVRRFLVSSLGPSDFRKNASWLASTLATCEPSRAELMELRLPDPSPIELARQALDRLANKARPVDGRLAKLAGLADGLAPEASEAIGARLGAFRHELETSGRAFRFDDCAVGNLIFAGCYLRCRRDFNAALEDYCRLLGLPADVIENVTDGRNAHLVAVDAEGRFLASEAGIVDATRRNRIREIALLDRPPSAEERSRLAGASLEEIGAYLRERGTEPTPNARLLRKLEQADLIVYAPGTQHSSLFPSYLTPGLGRTIASNPTAIKLLVTNIQEDAEIAESSALDLIERAVYYLRERGRARIPLPFLVTHYLLNDPTTPEREVPYVPLGKLDSLEDPRLLRVGSYEEGVSGRHNAEKILGPFVEMMLGPAHPPRIAVCLLATASLEKVSQSLIEMFRGGIVELPVSVEVLYHCPDSFEGDFAAELPLRATNVATAGGSAREAWMRGLAAADCDYVVLFESSGMYKGEDVVSLVSLLTRARVDAVWGSRRLSVRDIRESYRVRYRQSPLLGAVSYLGSHVLSLCYLLLYGRYVSDTLSGARAVRAELLLQTGLALDDPVLNQRLLSLVLRRRGELLEVPVQFLSLSPDKVRRTTLTDGLRAVLAAFAGRAAPRAGASARDPEPGA